MGSHPWSAQSDDMTWRFSARRLNPGRSTTHAEVIMWEVNLKRLVDDGPGDFPIAHGHRDRDPLG